MDEKQRTCLKCSRLFDSEGPSNRICPRCQKINDRLPRLTEKQLQKQRGVKRHNGELMDFPATERSSACLASLFPDRPND